MIFLGFHGMFDLGGLRLGFTYGNNVPDRVWDIFFICIDFPNYKNVFEKYF